jgi:hypothetical protein
MCISIAGAMRNMEHAVKTRPTGPSDFTDSNGTLSNSAAYANLAIEQAKGRKVLPMSNECGNPCPRGCPGFNYGVGCPGVEIKEGNGL